MSTVKQSLRHLQFCFKTLPHTYNLNVSQTQNPYKYKDLGILAMLKREEKHESCAVDLKEKTIQGQV